MKTCKKCKRTKHVDMFGNHLKAKDGKKGSCIKCLRLPKSELTTPAKTHKDYLEAAAKVEKYYKRYVKTL